MLGSDGGRGQTDDLNLSVPYDDFQAIILQFKLTSFSDKMKLTYEEMAKNSTAVVKITHVKNRRVIFKVEQTCFK